ncbi:hypothetical protein D3C80_1465160 [compost metagenome]
MTPLLGFIAKIRLENPCRADRKEIFINNRLRHDPPALNQWLRVITWAECLAVRLTRRRQTVAEIG